MKLTSGITVLLAAAPLLGCEQNQPSASRGAAVSTPPVACTQGTPVSGRFYPQAADINFRTGPGPQFERVLNQRATEIFGKPEYRTLSQAYVLEGRCQTDDWLQAKIVEADGEPKDWELGWVSKQYVSAAQSSDQQAGLLWDVSNDPELNTAEKELVRRGALKVLSDEPNCSEVVLGARDEEREGGYFVMCNGKNDEVFNVFFTREDVNQNRTLRVPTVFEEAASRTACNAAIRANAVHPSTLDIHSVVGYATQVHNNGNRTVIQDFTAQNSFGLALKYRARCLIEPNGAVEISVAEAQ